MTSVYRRAQLEQPYLLRRRPAFAGPTPGKLFMPQPWRGVSRHATQAEAEAAMAAIPVDPQYRLAVFHKHVMLTDDPRTHSPHQVPA